MSTTRKLTLVFTDRGLVISQEQWDDWRAVQAVFHDYTTSLGGHSIGSLFEYLSIEYPKREPLFNRALVERFAADSKARRLWASGHGWSESCARPAPMTVTDVFAITSLGTVIATDQDLSIDAPIGDHHCTLTLPTGALVDMTVRLQLVHFNPGGYAMQIIAPSYSADDLPVGTTIVFGPSG